MVAENASSLGGIVPGLSDLLTVVPPDIASSFNWLIVILKAAGVALIVYITYLIVVGILRLKRYKRIKRIERKVDEIDRKLDELLGEKKKRKTKVKKKKR